MSPMEKQSHNIVALPVDNVYKIIEAFFAGLKSENTRKAYQADIATFFRYLRNKDITQLTREDLNITYAEMNMYKSMLQKLYSSPLTVNRKLSTIRILYKKLSRSIGEFWNDEKISLVESVDVDSASGEANSYGFISYEEYLAILDAAGKQYKGKQKQIFLEIGLRTSFRLNAIRNLRWSNFIHNPEDKTYEVTGVDKGKRKHRKAISEDLYATMRKELYNEHDPEGQDAKIFTLSENTVGKMMRDACEKVGIDHDGKNIVFHSIRKLGVTMTHEISGDLKLAQAQSGHKDINTMINSYLPKLRKVGDMPLVRLGERLDTKVWHDMSKEELVALLESADYSTKVRLLRMAKSRG